MARTWVCGVGILLVLGVLGAAQPTMRILSPTTSNPEYRNASNCDCSRYPLTVTIEWHNMPANCSFRVISIQVGPVVDRSINMPDACPPSNGSAGLGFEESLCALACGAYNLTVRARYVDVEGVERTISATQSGAVVIEQPVDLYVTKTVDRDIVDEGDTVEFEVRAGGSGRCEATGVRVQDKLPPGLSYVSHRTTKGTYNPATGVWNIGTLAMLNGGDAVLVIEARVERGTAGRTLVNRASISGDQDDPNRANNSDSASVQVRQAGGGGGQADIAVTKSCNVPAAPEGSLVMFTVVVQNKGPSSATGVYALDKLPDGLTYLAHNASVGSYSPSTGRWDIGNLPASSGSEARLILIAVVNPGTSGQVLKNRAEVKGNETDPSPANNVAEASLLVGLTGPGQDDDHDGLPNPVDPCPSDPDCDDDGIPDNMDPCPMVAGVFCEGFRPPVVINEVGWAGTMASESDQWIELLNLQEAEVSLEGWRIDILTQEGLLGSIPLSGVIPSHGFYLAEHGHDKVISDVPAGSIFTILLPREGATLWLVTVQGLVVDVVNTGAGPWPAGLSLPGLKISMERIKPDAPGTAENWKNNNTVDRSGLDASGLPVNGTPGRKNSQP